MKSLLYIILLSLLFANSAYAHEEIAIKKTKADIIEIFDRDYKDQQAIKSIVLMHVNEKYGQYSAAVVCGEVAYIKFDDQLVSLNNYNKTITASVIAHELAHCYY